MGVYIPNMEKPKSCWRCDAGKIANCPIWMGVDSSSNYKDSIYPDCPLTEIVECKDCKHMEVDEYSGQMECTWGFEIECDDPYCGAWLIVNPKDFCPNGERRTDEHNTERD